jgi:hypothetical protein
MAEKYALIIGIENYPGLSILPRVSYAINDALEMAYYVRQAGFHLIKGKPLLDKEASYDQVISQLKLLFHYAKPEDFILLYYAGHGYYSEDGGYLIPFDYPKEHDIDEHTCISFDSINKRFKNKKTKRFLFFLDTCHSGFAVNQVDIRSPLSKNINVSLQTQKKIESQMEDMLEKNELSENVCRVIFTSSDPTEISHSIERFKHGLFTYYLLSGLMVKSRKKVINVEKLIPRVKDNILKYCSKHHLEQTPNAYTHIQGKFLIPAYKKTDKKIVLGTGFSHWLEKAGKSIEYEKFKVVSNSAEDKKNVETKQIQMNRNAQEKFRAYKEMTDRTIEEIENKIESFRNLREEYPGILNEEIDQELKRLTSIAEIHKIWQLEERILPGLSKKMNLLERIDKEKYSSAEFDIAEKIALTKSKIDRLKFDVWNKKYNNYNRISIFVYIVLNSLLSLLVISNYFIKGGIMNILGIVLFGIVTSIFLFMAGKWGLKNAKYSKRNKKISCLISLEFAKIFVTFSITGAAYLNILASPDIFFTASSFWFPITVALNIRAFLELEKAKLETPDKAKEVPSS